MKKYRYRHTWRKIKSLRSLQKQESVRKKESSINSDEEDENIKILRLSISESSKNSRTIYLIYISMLIFCILTVVTTSDQQIILNELVILPIVNLKVPLKYFFYTAPILIISLFIYFQFYLYINRFRINELKKKRPNTPSFYIYPWLINQLEFPENAFIYRLSSFVLKFLIWWSLPLVLVLFSVWTLKTHEYFFSYILGAYTFFGSLVSCFFWEKSNSQRRPKKGAIHVFKGSYFLIFIIFFFEIFYNFIIIPSFFESGRIAPKILKGFLYLDLSQKKLIDEIEEYSSLYWRNFSNIRLNGANLNRSILKRADLENSFILNASMKGTILEDANLKGAILDLSDLQHINLKNADLTGACLRGVLLKGANLTGAKFRDANFKNATFVGNIDFSGCNFVSAKFKGATLSGETLKGTNLSFADFEGAYLIKTNFERVNLRETVFESALLVNAEFKQCILLQTNFKFANLTESKFKDTRLDLVNFQNSELRKADFRNAIIVGTTFRDADLKDADFRYANLEYAEGLTFDQLSKVKSLYKAKLNVNLKRRMIKTHSHLFIYID